MCVCVYERGIASEERLFDVNAFSTLCLCGCVNASHEMLVLVQRKGQLEELKSQMRTAKRKLLRLQRRHLLEREVRWQSLCLRFRARLL